MKKRNSLPPTHIAYVEDADDDGHVLSGTEPKYARSVAPGSPRKQQPNTSKARRDSRRTADVCSSTDSSDSTAHPKTSKGKSKMKSKDERRSSAVVVSKRPAARSIKTAPPPSSRASDDSSAYYAFPHHVGSRPRAQTRPESYYGQSHSRPPPRMPISGPAFFQPPPPPPGMVPPSFPPPSWQAPFPGPMQPSLPPPPGPVDHHFPRDLAMRFRRPSSSMGFRQVSNPYEYEASPERSVERSIERSIERSVPRRSSMSRKAIKENKEHEDRKRMPPPPRPKSTRPERQERPERIVLKPQPSSNNRKSVVFDDDDLDDDSSLYQTVLRRGSGVEYGSSPFKNSRQSYDATESVFNYEDDEEEEEEEEEEEYYYEEEPPPRHRSRSRRRSHAGIEDKMRDASRYQDHMGGGATSALTAEALRKVKTGGSSRSTRSSASRDESEYKHSATTHTTRSSSGEDDITIKVSAGCVVEVGNVKIHSMDGGEVSVGRTGASRTGSDRGTSIYGDERLLRDDRRSRSSARMRANSQAAYARGLPAPSSYTPSPLYSRYDYEDDDSC
ncbi:hypothetical protein F4859DRAFT_38776 [Xylaria cf. heliscus]|nr:hypothetical protein F4859DRAFT_38776 [Xylaria cf. heliscus]